jgi:hypothetical protein
MAFGRLGAANSTLGGGTYNVYQVPTGKIAKVSITVASSLIEDNVKIFISPTNTPTDEHVIHSERFDTDVTGVERTAVILLAGEWVSFSSTDEGTSCVVNGIEYDADGFEISDSGLISTNAETVLYTAPSLKQSVVNLTVTLTDNSETDICSTKLYISSGTASTGYLYNNLTLRFAEIVGYERTAIPLKAGDKLILVSDDISGTVSYRLHGYERDE